MPKLPNLNDLLQYENPLILERFKVNHPNDAHRAEQLFTEMLRYLWLCEKHSVDSKNNPHHPGLKFIPVMHEEMRPIDNMWHEFILVTRDYHEFCNHYFGCYLHHEPDMKQTLAYSENEFIESLNLFLNYVFDTLGEEVMKLWFQPHFEDAA